MMLHASSGFQARGLDEAVGTLPTAVVLDRVHPLYDDASSAGIAVLDGGVASSVPESALVFCPHLAAKLGLKCDPTNPWTYYDENGDIVAQSLWWRDGGLRRIDTDRSISGAGFVVRVTAELWSKIASLIQPKRIMEVWRRATSDGEQVRGKFPNGRSIMI
jgi:hypothetical protein